MEQIGSVYETMMGFRLETAQGRSAAVRAASVTGAPATVNLEALLAEPYGSRAKWLQEHADRKLTDRVKRSVQAADTVEQSHAALDPVLDAQATPDLVPAGAMVLQPSEERRRSGSRYTPRELTELIVPDRTRADPGAPRGRRRPIASAGSDPGHEGVRPGDGIGGVPGRGVPAAWGGADRARCRALAGQGAAPTRMPVRSDHFRPEELARHEKREN